MNLVKKTNTYYLLFLMLLFPVMIAVDYFLIQYLVNNEVEDILLQEEERIQFHLDKEGVLPASNYLFFTAPKAAPHQVPGQFKDTLVYEAYAEKHIPYKTYTFAAPINAQPFNIVLKHTLLEINELIWLLFLSTSLIILLLGLGLYYINRKIYTWAWTPFFKNLTMLKQYDLTKKNEIYLQSSNINEFEELNQVIATLMDHAKRDFQNLKEFNENISHEIQTPLAIIRNKVVALMESKNLDEKELQRVDSVYHEVNKLSKIGKSLTLISRIENQEFQRLDQVQVHVLIENILNNMEEIIAFKALAVALQLTPVTMECDHILADILFTNFIKNAVQHNTEGGTIQISLTQDRFEITNTGETTEVTSEKLFQRFHRGGNAQESLGLGLAINQKICEIYGFTVEYDQTNQKHRFSLVFKNQP